MLFDWPGFFLYVVIQTFTPGPNTMSTLANASRVGVKRNMPFALGIVTGVVGITFACGMIYDSIHQLIPQIKPVMLVVGAVYLLYLAWKIYKTDFEAERSRPIKGNTYLNGIMLEFVNPKLILYSLTVMSNYVVGVYHGPLMIAGFALLVGLVCFASLLSYALFGSLILRTLTKYGKLVNIVLALALVYCAISLFL
ncbi:LysE family transporter [Eubacteriales bacterium OttesenSCG-928-N13]|nr:LysE family transporter [Eubacteriales bacterium OttesenSCG-928-N13]